MLGQRSQFLDKSQQTILVKAWGHDQPTGADADYGGKDRGQKTPCVIHPGLVEYLTTTAAGE